MRVPTHNHAARDRQIPSLSWAPDAYELSWFEEGPKGWEQTFGAEECRPQVAILETALGGAERLRGRQIRGFDRRLQPGQPADEQGSGDAANDGGRGY